MSQLDVRAEIERLIDRWCERRELAYLRIILPAWPMAMGLTDEVAELASALKHLKAMHRDTMPADELKTIRLLWSALDQRQ